MRTIIAISLSLLILGCPADSTLPALPAPAPPPPGPTDAAPGAAPADRVDIAGRTYVLTASVWRDFMPGPAPRPLPLLASVRLQARGDQPPPAGVLLKSWSIRSGDDVWRIDLKRIDRRPGQFVARNGPAWTVGEIVEIDIRFELPDGRSAPLGLRGVPIERTD